MGLQDDLDQLAVEPCFLGRLARGFGNEVARALPAQLRRTLDQGALVGLKLDANRHAGTSVGGSQDILLSNYYQHTAKPPYVLRFGADNFPRQSRRN